MTGRTRRRARRAALAIGGVVATAAAVVAVATLRWHRETGRAIGRLDARAAPRDVAPAPRFARERLAGLPAPVARYLALALAPGQPIARWARLEWRGEFRTSARGAWRPFTAGQRVTASPPGFVWDASIRMAPLLVVRVRDGYLDGEGTMRGAVAALVTVVDEGGTPEMAAGALARWLGEAVWLPTALLPGDGVEWAAVDDSTARATLTDGDVRVAVDFHFGPGGEVVGVSGERYRDVNGTGVLTPWRGRLWDHERVHGMLVPRSGEVAWLLPEGPFAYWRGRLVRAWYEPAP